MRVLIVIAVIFLAAPFVRYATQESETRAIFWPNGNIRSEIQASRNLDGRLIRQGAAVLYYEQGGVLARGAFQGDKKHGRWEWFHTEGWREAACDYDHGAGHYRYFYRDGSVMQEGRVVGESREGSWRDYYPSGRLRLTGSYRDNLQHGTWTGYTDEDPPRNQSVEFVDGVQQEAP